AFSEEEFTLLTEIREAPCPGLQQFEHSKKPGVPLSQIRVAPEPSRFKYRFQPHAELVGREPREVLRVEPIQLFQIEYSAPAADALERECRHELLSREQLSITFGAVRRPAKQ